MSDYAARRQLHYEIEAYIKAHPGCTQTDIVKRLYPKFDTAFARTAYPDAVFRKFVQEHITRLMKRNDIVIGEHPTKTVKSRPMRTFTWRQEDGKDQTARDAD